MFLQVILIRQQWQAMPVGVWFSPPDRSGRAAIVSRTLPSAHHRRRYVGGRRIIFRIRFFRVQQEALNIITGMYHGDAVSIYRRRYGRIGRHLAGALRRCVE